MKKVIYILIAMWCGACSLPIKKKNEKTGQWSYLQTIALDSISPIGVTDLNKQLWISDADANRIVVLDSSFAIQQIEENLDRPMHILSRNNAVYVAEYGSDLIQVFQDGKREKADIDVEMDAPSGVDFVNGIYYIADFYNHRIVAYSKDSVFMIGSQGKDSLGLNYPTDVQVEENKIYIADAYNHRVQVFDLKGNFIQTIGEAEKMNAATGIYVDEKYIYVTDFENNRVLVYHKGGVLHQILTDNLDKPTDLLIFNGKLLVVNFNGKSITVFQFL